MHQRWIYILLFILAASAACPQSSEFTFRKISLEEGLSQSSVMCIFQDSKGFLWFGTSNGLNKYDGYNFTVYKHDPDDSTTLSSDMITAIEEDKKGNLWIGTEDGLNLFNPVTEKAKVYLPLDSKNNNSGSVSSLLIDENILWTGTMNGGIRAFNTASGKIQSVKIFENGPKSSYFNSINSIKKDKNGKLWIASRGGILLFDPLKKTWINILQARLKRNSEVKSVFAVTIDEHNIVWFTSAGDLYKYDISGNVITSFPIPYKAGQPRYRVSSLLADSHGNIWLGTAGAGIWLFSKTSNSFSHIENNPLRQGSLSSNSIMALYEDTGGIIWIGTTTSGINKYKGFKNKFQHFSHDPENNNTISGGLIYGMAEDADGALWIGTTDGANRIDKNGKVLHFNKTSGLSDNIITAIDADKAGNVWITTQGGLNKYNIYSKKLTLYLADSTKKNWIKNNQMSEVYVDNDQSVWIGNFNYGILHYIPAENKFIEYCRDSGGLNSNNILSIAGGPPGTLLIGTQAGLNIFDKKTGRVIKVFTSGKSQQNLSNSVILSSLYDDGFIWAGTYGGGLNKIDLKNNKVYRFSEKQGMPNNVVYGILPDKQGNLWISTNKGLVRFNKETNAIRVYDPSDGLQSYEFNSNSYCLSRSGRMYFGGVNGFNSFIPEKVTDNKNIPQVVITSVNSLEGLIKKGSFVKAGKPVELSYKQNFLTFDFVSLDYTNPPRNKYAYKLEGFDKNWIPAGTWRMAIYTNLAPGEYVFRVKASNSDDVWNDQGAAFSFIINPPFWSTWWFYSLMLVLVAASVVLIHKYRVRLKLKRIVEMEEMRKKIADDFHDELGHKLTKISLYSELMRENLNNAGENRESYLKKINDAANNLFDDTKDFIWSIDPVKDTLYDLAVYLKDFGDEFFDRTGIAFRVSEISTSLSGIILPMDWKRQLILIFKEGMNNCLKHSGCKNVCLSVLYNDGQIEITLSDDGKGILYDPGAKGRGIGNMKTRAEKLKADLTIEGISTGGTLIKFTGGNFKLTEMKKHSKVIT